MWAVIFIIVRRQPWLPWEPKPGWAWPCSRKGNAETHAQTVPGLVLPRRGRRWGETTLQGERWRGDQCPPWVQIVLNPRNEGKRCPLCVCGKCVCTHVYTWERCFRSGNKRFMTHLSSDFLQGCGIKARDNEVEVAKLDQDFCKNKDIRGLIKIMKLKQTKLWGPSPKGLTLI